MFEIIFYYCALGLIFGILRMEAHGKEIKAVTEQLNFPEDFKSRIVSITEILLVLVCSVLWPLFLLAYVCGFGKE